MHLNYKNKIFFSFSVEIKITELCSVNQVLLTYSFHLYKKKLNVPYHFIPVKFNTILPN